MASQSVVVKVACGNELRRFGLERPSFQLLVQTAAIVFNLPSHFQIKYRDDDDEEITIGSDMELAESFALIRGPNSKQKVLRLTIAKTDASNREALNKEQFDPTFVVVEKPIATVPFSMPSVSLSGIVTVSSDTNEKGKKKDAIPAPALVQSLDHVELLAEATSTCALPSPPTTKQDALNFDSATPTTTTTSTSTSGTWFFGLFGHDSKVEAEQTKKAEEEKHAKEELDRKVKMTQTEEEQNRIVAMAMRSREETKRAVEAKQQTEAVVEAKRITEEEDEVRRVAAEKVREECEKSNRIQQAAHAEADRMETLRTIHVEAVASLTNQLRAFINHTVVPIIGLDITAFTATFDAFANDIHADFPRIVDMKSAKQNKVSETTEEDVKHTNDNVAEQTDHIKTAFSTTKEAERIHVAAAVRLIGHGTADKLVADRKATRAVAAAVRLIGHGTADKLVADRKATRAARHVELKRAHAAIHDEKQRTAERLIAEQAEKMRLQCEASTTQTIERVTGRATLVRVENEKRRATAQAEQLRLEREVFAKRAITEAMRLEQEAKRADGEAKKKATQLAQLEVQAARARAIVEVKGADRERNAFQNDLDELIAMGFRRDKCITVLTKYASVTSSSDRVPRCLNVLLNQ